MTLNSRFVLASICLTFLFSGCESEKKPINAPVVPHNTAPAAVDNLIPQKEAVGLASVPDSPISENMLSILAWNVESGGADPKVIAERLARLNAFDILCLSEVHPDDFSTYQNSRGPDFDTVTSKSGNEDRLQIIYNAKRFELLEKIELASYRDYVVNNGSHRSPTAVRLKDRVSGKSFIIMVNHLARGNAEFRKTQAIGLREWARDQSMGVINVGDFNMDYVFATEKGNDALDEILRDNVWKWVKPKTWVDSNWWDPEGDGVDNYEGSLLDFAFVSGPANMWSPSCQVIVESEDFPDDETTSDHRPISLVLDLGRS